MTPRRIAVLSLGITFTVIIAWCFWGNRNDKKHSTVETYSENPSNTPEQSKRDAKHKVVSMMKTISSVMQNIEDASTEQDGQNDLVNDDNDFADAIARSKQVDLIFAHEPRDSAWADEMEVRITSLINNGDFRESQIIDSMCKTTFCRVEMHHEQMESREDFERVVSLYNGGTLLQHLELNADRSSNSVVYFVRPEMKENNVVYKLMHQESL